MAKRTITMRPTSAKIPEKLRSRVQKLSKLKQKTAHCPMKDAIEHHHDAEENAERFKQETLARWDNALEQTIIENKKVISWLETWRTKQRIPEL